MSADLQWAILRNQSSFIVRKRKGTQGELTSEPNNLTQLNSFKFSGLANCKVVGVDVQNKKVALTTKKLKGCNKPKTGSANAQLNKHMVKGSCRAAETITKLTSGHHYRGDLTKFAVARYHALHKSLSAKPAKTTQRKRRRVVKA